MARGWLISGPLPSEEKPQGSKNRKCRYVAVSVKVLINCSRGWPLVDAFCHLARVFWRQFQTPDVCLKSTEGISLQKFRTRELDGKPGLRCHMSLTLPVQVRFFGQEAHDKWKELLPRRWNM